MAHDDLTGHQSTTALKQDIRALLVALVVVRMKPLELSIKDFILRIRNHICSGTRPERVNANRDSYLDSLALYKDLYTRSAAKCRSLEDQLYQLEPKNSLLQQKFGPTEDSSRASSLRKRKRDIPASQSNTIKEPLPKKRRTETITQSLQSTEDKAHVILSGLELSIENTQSSNHMRLLHTLQSFVSYRRLVYKDLASCLVQMSLSSENMLSDSQSVELEAAKTADQTGRCKERSHEKHSRRSQDDRARITVIRRTFTCLLRGLDTMSQCEEGRSLQGQVIYSFVKIFQKIVELIKNCSERSSRVAGLMPAETMRRDRLKPKPAASTKVQQNSSDIRDELCRLYVFMMACLDYPKSSHRDVREGAMSFLLERVGTVLNMFVFGTADGPTVAGSNGPTHQDHGSLAMESEAPYLVWVLERTVALMRPPFRIPNAKNLKNSGGFRKAHNENGVAKKHNHVQSRLQNTLLRAMFPDDTATFEDRFRVPSTTGLHLQTQVYNEADENIKVWYKQEIWRLVGWDVLQKQIEWD